MEPAPWMTALGSVAHVDVDQPRDLHRPWWAARTPPAPLTV